MGHHTPDGPGADADAGWPAAGRAGQQSLGRPREAAGGAERAGERRDAAHGRPPEAAGVVLVPTDGPWRPGHGEPRVRLGQAPDGAPVVLAYSSPAALAEVHGRQPWVAVPRAELLRALRPLGVSRLVLDGRQVRADG